MSSLKIDTGGGNVLAKHGMEKSIGDAMDKYHAMHSRVAELEKDLADCFRLTGADPDSNEDWRLARWAVKEVAAMRTDLDLVEARVAELESALERERMRLVACGVIAMANTPESAAKARDMHPDYWSESAADVARAVDAEMAARGAK